jgi:hypothetical protein
VCISGRVLRISFALSWLSLPVRHDGKLFHVLQRAAPVTPAPRGSPALTGRAPVSSRGISRPRRAALAPHRMVFPVRQSAPGPKLWVRGQSRVTTRLETQDVTFHSGLPARPRARQGYVSLESLLLFRKREWRNRTIQGETAASESWRHAKDFSSKSSTFPLRDLPL